MRLAIASAFTLFLLSGMVFSVLFAFAYIAGYVSAYFLIALVIFFNFLFWLLGPTISDFIYKWLYGMRWISLDSLRERSEAAAEIIVKTCKKYGIKIPKLGIIPDRNPNAFTYGSGRWNARIIVTEGIFEYLDENEIAAVYAHELGHIKNRDFIIMALASLLLQLLYELYVICKNAGARAEKEKSKSMFFLLATISYIFYFIGQYILLYLSRIREYYADEFSAKETHPNYLASALIKIAYGILANPDNVRLVESTKFLGIMNFHSAKSIGMVYYNCENLGDFEPLAKALLFDIYNPWAFVSELSSTHPLTGKRIRRLCKLSDSPLFDFKALEAKYKIDRKKLWKNFVKDALVTLLPTLAVFIYIPVSAYLLYTGMLSLTPFIFGGFFVILGIAIIIRTLYRYPSGSFVKSNILELMGDVYASPVRGKRVYIEGEIVGRGIPGYVFSEDMLFKDSTGLIYINYESWLPCLGNLIFALTRVNKLIGKKVVIKGWFLRGLSQQVVVDVIEADKQRIRGFSKLGGIIGGAIFIGIGVLIMLLV